MNKRELKRQLSYNLPRLKLVLVRENERKRSLVAIRAPQDLADYVKPLRAATEEYVVAFHLNATLQVTGFHEVSHGTLSSSLVHPREVFKAAVAGNSFALILAHNHPGGTTQPSHDDLETTRQVYAAGKILGIELVDHVIVTSDEITSIREICPSVFEGTK